MSLTATFGGTAGVGIHGIGTVVPTRVGRPGNSRDELQARWKNQILGRPSIVRQRSCSLSAYGLLMPKDWQKEEGFILPIGSVRHVSFARRLNRNWRKGSNGFPYYCPVTSFYASTGNDVTAPPIGICRDTLISNYDLSCLTGGNPKKGHGNAIPKEERALMELALDMEESIVEGHFNNLQVRNIPEMPRYYGSFTEAPDVEESRAAVDLMMDILRGPEGTFNFLPSTLSSPGGVVSDIETSDDGGKIVIFNTANGAVSRFFPPMAVLEHYVQVGNDIAQGTRIAHYATPRKYPSWGVVKKEILKQYAMDILNDVISDIDVVNPGQIIRDVVYCPKAVIGRKHKTIFEDVSSLVDENGKPIIQVCPHLGLFSEFVQNGCKVFLNIWSPNVRQAFQEEAGTPS